MLPPFALDDRRASRPDPNRPYPVPVDAVTHPTLVRLVERARSDSAVLALVLFGSHARGEASPASDVDVCLVLGPDGGSDVAMAEQRLEYLAIADVDIAVFQQLPLPIRSRVLREGRVLFVRDEDMLYDLATRTMRAFERFRPYYRRYLDAVAGVDRDRVLGTLDELAGYLAELPAIAPASLEAYAKIETRRACERLLQISIEAVIDMCALLVAGLRLGCPGEEDDLFEKLLQRGVISEEMTATVRRMRGLRTILVHEYGRTSDGIVFQTIAQRLGDFGAFERAVLAFLRR